MKSRDVNGNNLLHRAAIDLNEFVFNLVIKNIEGGIDEHETNQGFNMNKKQEDQKAPLKAYFTKKKFEHTIKHWFNSVNA